MLIKISLIALSLIFFMQFFSSQIHDNTQVLNLLFQPSLASTSVQMKIISLSVREERRLPSGATPDPNRDIGFASVLIRLENSQEKTQIIVIDKIEIKGVFNPVVYCINNEPKIIDLKPLENSDMVFHLTNKTGYIGQDRVKAFIYYRINNQKGILESQSVEVDRL
ncbi:MAG: hypothetical protein KA714_20495 [Limnoraphis sp. WC205]|jgi:hypothetical protein|nr:hypothetical protein [Limnoraphis sp. WC205]